TMLRSKYAELPARRTRRTAISPPVVVSARAKCQARWRRWVAIVSSWDTVDSSDKYCVPVLRTASCPASMAGPIAVRSTQFGAGKALVFACNLVLVTGYIFPPSCTRGPGANALVAPAWRRLSVPSTEEPQTVLQRSRKSGMGKDPISSDIKEPLHPAL